MCRVYGCWKGTYVKKVRDGALLIGSGSACGETQLDAREETCAFLDRTPGQEEDAEVQDEHFCEQRAAKTQGDEMAASYCEE